jgi:hypothetical protein
MPGTTNQPLQAGKVIRQTMQREISEVRVFWRRFETGRQNLNKTLGSIHGQRERNRETSTNILLGIHTNAVGTTGFSLVARFTRNDNLLHQMRFSKKKIGLIQWFEQKKIGCFNQTKMAL